MEAKQARDVVRDQIVKALKVGDLDSVVALLAADEKATEALAVAVQGLED